MVRAVALIVATAVVWLLAGAAGALGSSWWWLVAAVPTVALLAAPFLLYPISKGRTGPAWVAFAAMLALLPTAYAVPGDWYMRYAGERTSTVVMSATCSENRDGRCLYNYTLADVEGEYRDTAEYPPGTPLEVVTDPRGVFGPRLAVDLESRIFDIAAAVAFALFAAAAITAALLGRTPHQSWSVPASRPRMKKRPRRT
ncbi:hypothetical protein KZZ52_19580 [Dactylosporangium sp. AC04546]|uniref:hypothetical protein n=1 Tax=Dactylosporangium sp. AC04546 TaxID=2862460 RepID=UPI001EDDE13C|nr:hypothetical protein [Dactylosporangium sp. AC04546]WVK87503.1 hypothetical protein KZZ52_19580 [Dactylosporangium sp. AC04546]